MPANPVRFKQSEILRAIRSAVKANLTVSGYTIEPNGAISVHTDSATTDTGNPLDEWLGKHSDAGQA